MADGKLRIKKHNDEEGGEEEIGKLEEKGGAAGFGATTETGTGVPVGDGVLQVVDSKDERDCEPGIGNVDRNRGACDGMGNAKHEE